MILTEIYQKTTIITIQDKILDAPKAFRIKGELKALITQQNINLIMDLSSIEVIDSAGFGIFISVLKRIRFLNGHLKLIGVSPELSDLFQFLSLHKIFDICKNKEEAIASFSEIQTKKA